MKLIIQIPCLNEEKTIGVTIEDINAVKPELLKLVDEVEILIIDDGSTDNTIETARQAGADHIIKLPSNQGLAIAFQEGMQSCYRLGANIAINSDADNQYSAQSIPDLIKPIVDKKADIVVGTRDIKGHPEFSNTKKKLQKIGSKIVSKTAGIEIEDTTSGFRAYSKKAISEILVRNDYTYTLESLIAAGKSNLTVVGVPIGVNAKTRDSRLFKSIPSYIGRSTKVIIKSAVLYSPIRFFGTIAIILGLISLVSFLPWIIDFLKTGGTSGHLQSIIIGVAFFISSVQFFGLAVLGNLIRINRQTSEKVLYVVRNIATEAGVAPEYIICYNNIDE